MKVLVINDRIEGGGAEKVMHELVTWLSASGGYEITMVSLSEEREAFSRLYPQSVTYFPYDMEKPYRYKRFSPRWVAGQIERRFRRLWLMHQSYDLVLAMKEGPSTALGAQVRAKKKLAWVHVDYRQIYWTQYCFGDAQTEVACMQRYDHVVCVSETAASSVREVIGDPGNLVVRLNPMDVDRICTLGGQACDATAGAGLLFVSVGRLAEEKGVDRLLRVCQRLNRDFSFRLWILGDGPQRKQLESMICELGLENVTLLGNRNNPYPYMKAADCLVSSSHGESYGLVLQEALVLGVPVLATTCPAFEECVSGEEAMLVENSEEALYAGMRKLLADPAILQSLRNGIGTGRSQKIMKDDRLKEIERLWTKKE